MTILHIFSEQSLLENVIIFKLLNELFFFYGRFGEKKLTSIRSRTSIPCPPAPSIVTTLECVIPGSIYYHPIIFNATLLFPLYYNKYITVVQCAMQ